MPHLKFLKRGCAAVDLPQMVNIKRFEAALRRKNEGGHPLPLDNLWLMERGEEVNPLPERTPEHPGRSSIEAQVLALLHRRPHSVKELHVQVDVDDSVRIRGAIDRLRAKWAWPIVNEGGKFHLLIKAA